MKSKLGVYTLLACSLTLGDFSPDAKQTDGLTALGWSFGLTQALADCKDDDAEDDCMTVTAPSPMPEHTPPIDGGNGSSTGTPNPGGNNGSNSGSTNPDTTTPTGEQGSTSEPSAKDQCVALAKKDFANCEFKAKEIKKMDSRNCNNTAIDYFSPSPCMIAVQNNWNRDIAQCKDIRTDEINQCSNKP